jgi:hypothetical protein
VVQLVGQFFEEGKIKPWKNPTCVFPLPSLYSLGRTRLHFLELIIGETHQNKAQNFWYAAGPAHAFDSLATLCAERESDRVSE